MTAVPASRPLAAILLATACGSAPVEPVVVRAESPTSGPPVASAHPSALGAARWPDVNLPSSTASEPVPPGIPVLVVSKSEIAFEGEPPLGPLPSDRTHGVDATYKGSGPNDLAIPSLATAMRARVHRVPGDMAFAFDATTPYRLVVEVLFNAGQSSVSTFHLIVAHADGTLADLRAMAPRAQPPPELDPQPSLGFTVIIVADGISLKGRGGNVAPGCAATGAGLAIPNKNGAYDLDQLRLCTTRIRAATPEMNEDHRA